MKRRILCLTTVFALLFSCVAFATETAFENCSIKGNGEGYISIVVKGEENIKAYEDAGLIKRCDKTSLENVNTVYSSRGTSIPTAVLYNVYV